jgi:hypothetical protein
MMIVIPLWMTPAEGSRQLFASSLFYATSREWWYFEKK